MLFHGIECFLIYLLKESQPLYMMDCYPHFICKDTNFQNVFKGCPASCNKVEDLEFDSSLD